MRKLGSTSRAIAILAGAAVAAFAVSTAAVSSANTTSDVPAISVKYPFAAFSFSGQVSPAGPVVLAGQAGASTFSLNFASSFTLAAASPGIVNSATGTLDAVTVQERVSYPVPGGRVIGPVQLPFKAEQLTLIIVIKGSCFIPDPASNEYVFHGTVKCATATLTLAGKTYKVSSLLKAITGKFVPVVGAASVASATWNASLAATFANPGYTFPVATLGRGGGTSLIIGPNGASLGTQSIIFTGGAQT
jgi:hypothetical protein